MPCANHSKFAMKKQPRGRLSLATFNVPGKGSLQGTLDRNEGRGRLVLVIEPRFDIIL
jgi:hypothetical protein